MTLKVKLFDKKTHQEIDDIMKMKELQNHIESIVKEKYFQYDFKISIYGEIVFLK